MSWIQKLYDTYDNSRNAIGVQTSAEGENEKVPLLPICHTTNKAQIEITIDGEGNFIRASVIPKNESRTIIPCTEKSGGRTSGPMAHPLADKLQYVAKDYATFGGTKDARFNLYQEELGKWAQSPYSHPKIIAIQKYVLKGNIIRDLVNYQVLFVDSNNELISKWEKSKENPTPPIFEVTKIQEEAFIRWRVEIPGEMESRTWADQTLWEKWIDFYLNQKKHIEICSVSGIPEPIADQHPAKIRNDGDSAKLVSSNDSQGFTFRGRFETADQAAAISYITTQKAHSALRWLISRQGFRNGDQIVVAWATNGKSIPQPTDDSLSLLGFDELQSVDDFNVFTGQSIGVQIRKALAGYRQSIGNHTNVVVMGLDSATPGRLSIIYYRDLEGSAFLNHLTSWYATCQWKHSYRYVYIKNNDSEKFEKKFCSFTGTASPKDIAEGAYGERVDEKLRKKTIERLLPCIVDEQPLPIDLVYSAINQAKQRNGKERGEWEKSLSIACMLFRKHFIKENYEMTLEEDRNTRDYLYGRLLALAESLENWALRNANDKRETNAARLMQRFAERPFSTWRTLELALSPYKSRLGIKANGILRQIDEITASFTPDDFISDKPLSGEFLLGYHCQREAMRKSKEENESFEDEPIDIES